MLLKRRVHSYTCNNSGRFIEEKIKPGDLVFVDQFIGPYKTQGSYIP